jgi:hypothetical protein
VAREAVFETDQSIEYIVDGDAYAEAGPLVLRTRPRIEFVRLTGSATEEAALPEPVGADNGERP